MELLKVVLVVFLSQSFCSYGENETLQDLRLKISTLEAKISELQPKKHTEATVLLKSLRHAAVMIFTMHVYFACHTKSQQGIVPEITTCLIAMMAYISAKISVV